MELPYVSVIIPTYNLGPILLNTLLSLKYQKYPHSRYEIVLVNDASTDNTMDVLIDINIENFKVVHKLENRGAGAARNTGLENSEGKLIIFCDSDIVVPSHFISSHANAHKIGSNYAISGMGHWKYIFSYDYCDEWLPSQKKDIAEVYNREFIKQRMKESKYLLKEQDIVEENFQPFIFNSQHTKIWSLRFEEIIHTFGECMENFQYPWLSFCTGNLSLKKDCLRSLGGFDETFLRLEDWELGYRFFQEGGKFIFSNKAEAYQQHHPINQNRINLENVMFKQLCFKYPSIEIFLLALSLRGGMSFPSISNVLEQHKQLRAYSPKLSPMLKRFEERMKNYALEDNRYQHLNRKEPKLNKYINTIQKSNLFKKWLDTYHLVEIKQ